MARRRARTPLSVYLNSRRLGMLRRETSGAIDFQYDADWLAWESAIPVSTSMPLREDRYIGAPVSAVFDNLLPDNADIRRHLAERTGADGTDAFSLLSAVGRDCVGALQFLPEGVAPDPAGTISGRPIDEKEIARILSGLKRNPLGVGEDEEFRISIAGAQEKTALLRWKDKWHVPHGTTATTHILKPQIGRLPNGIDLSHSVENEHFCLRIVAELGLPVARSEIADFDGRRALVVERFDRRWTHDGRLLRLPQEDCCQALSVPPTRKYESEGGPGMKELADHLKASDTPEADLRVLMKAQIVYWLLGATDGHAKNFSIFLSPGGRFRLAPLYDVMSAQPNLDAGQIQRNPMKLAMAVGKTRHYVVHTIAPRHFIETAGLCGIPSSVVAGLFDELVADGRSALDCARNALPSGFPARLARAIATGFGERLHVVEMALSDKTR